MVDLGVLRRARIEPGRLSQSLAMMRGYGESCASFSSGTRRGARGPNVERRFAMDDMVAAHRYMEANRGTGKLVALIDN